MYCYFFQLICKNLNEQLFVYFQRKKACHKLLIQIQQVFLIWYYQIQDQKNQHSEL